MSRRKFSWTKHNLDKLNKVKIILKELDEYKPLTLRQIYYQLVGKGYIENNKSQYTMLSTLLKNARIENLIDWSDMEDRVRVFNNYSGFEDEIDFINNENYYFLENYKRNLLQTQDYIEIWIEKDALSTIFSKIAKQYTIPVVVCKGFSSVSFLNNLKDRASNCNRKITMLYFGDLDPSGMAMLEAMQTTLIDEMNVSNIEFKRKALELEDVEKYNLPHNPDAVKAKDSRAKKYVEKYGDVAVELDALDPRVLEDKIEKAILDEIDIDKFATEKAIYLDELIELKKLKDATTEFIINYKNV